MVALLGNGNHCDLVARLLLATALPQGELAAHYRAALFRGALSDKAIPAVVALRREPEGGAARVEVRLIDAGNPAGLDPRCH